MQHVSRKNKKQSCCWGSPTVPLTCIAYLKASVRLRVAKRKQFPIVTALHSYARNGDAAISNTTINTRYDGDGCRQHCI